MYTVNSCIWLLFYDVLIWTLDPEVLKVLFRVYFLCDALAAWRTGMIYGTQRFWSIFTFMWDVKGTGNKEKRKGKNTDKGNIRKRAIFKS